MYCVSCNPRSSICVVPRTLKQFQLREDFDGGGDIAFCEDVAIHDVATLLKEFFRDLPEPLIPKDLLPGLLAVQSKGASRYDVRKFPDFLNPPCPHLDIL